MAKDGRIGVRRKPSKRRRTGSALAKAVADYLTSDCYMYAPLVEPHQLLDSSPPASVRSPRSTEFRTHRSVCYHVETISVSSDKGPLVSQVQGQMGK